MGALTIVDGLYTEMLPETYHADPFQRPPGCGWPDWGSLTQSLAKHVLSEPAARWKMRHPRLGAVGQEDREKRALAGIWDPTAAQLVGAIADCLIFGGEEDYRRRYLSCLRNTIAGKDAAELAEREGKRVITPSIERAARRIVDVLRSKLSEIEPDWECWQKQVAALWLEDGCPARGLLDWVDSQGGRILDLKTCQRLDDRSLQNDIARYGYDIQAGAYTSAMDILSPRAEPWRFEWVFVEKQPPFDVRVMEASTSMIAYGQRRWRLACARWKQALETGSWPGYSRGLVEPSEYALSRQAELEASLAAHVTADIDFQPEE